MDLGNGKWTLPVCLAVCFFPKIDVLSDREFRVVWGSLLGLPDVPLDEILGFEIHVHPLTCEIVAHEWLRSFDLVGC